MMASIEGREGFKYSQRQKVEAGTPAVSEGPGP